MSTGAADAMRNAGAFASDLVRPTVRLGVTGLAGSGKTVFITALVQNLVAGGRLPFFRAVAEERITGAWLEPQPDDTVPRFEIEQHLAQLMGAPPAWPTSTRRISQLRVTLEYAPDSIWRHVTGSRRLHVDIIDYPGEWLLDLPLMRLSYADWSREALMLSRSPARQGFALDWHSFLGTIDPGASEDEQVALKGAGLFTAYLKRCRVEAEAFTGLTPGRFLMPGDLEGSPALTFMPLDLAGDAEPGRGSLAAMMARRYEAYKTHVVRPFFTDHFSRLDRQIVLVDVLSALNAGPDAVTDLGTSLAAVLACFRPGTNDWLSRILSRRIDRIAFAATKADHLHHTSHDRLEAVLGKLTETAITRAQFSGAKVKVMAIAAVRATRESEVRKANEKLPCIIGTPMAGERLGTQTFDGATETAVFPGDLAADADAAIRAAGSQAGDLQFLRFRPPVVKASSGEPRPAFPHIRLDRVLDFLIGDRLT